MPAIIENSVVEDCLREILLKEGYLLNKKRAHGQTGVDILATKDDAEIHIEAIAYKSSGSARAKDFFESFFRCISRLNDGAKRCVLALSKKAEVGLPARADHHSVAWKRIGNGFPELEIWIVDTEENTYRQTKWNEWL